MSELFKTEHPLKIIIVDDSEFSRHSISSILEAAGHDILGEAANAEQTLEILSSRKADLIILDVVMPDVTGLELAKHINDNFDNIYIIMISSLAQEHIILEAISAGASDFIQKPFKQSDLIISVEKISSQVKEDKNI